MPVKRILYWSIPPLFCLAFYWYGLKAWFQMDDFAWLGLHRLVYDFDTFVDTVFQPMAQGTIRPLSERLFFLGFWHWFGMEALPYRALVFGTQFANLALITIVTRRLTGSAAAGFVSPLLWLVSPVLYESMSWTSAYNQILCALFLLTAFYFLLRWLEAGRKRYYAAMWIAFLLGFGALELNVVFPAIAAVYVLIFARKYLAGIVPMFAVSAAYAVLHRSVASGRGGSTYAMNLHALSMLSVFWQYVQLTFSAEALARVSDVPQWALLTAGGVALTGLIVFMLHKRNGMVLFLLAWFVITIGPYLPLSNHVSDYYLTVPVIGLAIMGAWGIVSALQAGVTARAIAVCALLSFAIPCAVYARYMTKNNFNNSLRVRSLVRGLAAAHRLHPDKAIILAGVDGELFRLGINDRPQIALGWTTGLYVTSELRETLEAHSSTGDIGDFLLSEGVIRSGIHQGAAVVYDVSQSRLRNVTRNYERLLSLKGILPLPNAIHAGSRLYSQFLKEGFYRQVAGDVWSRKTGTVEMRGPTASPAKLRVLAYVTPLHTGNGPLAVRAYVNGSAIGERQIPQGQTDCRLSFDLPETIVGQPAILVSIEVDRTVVSPPDPRQLGLLFGSIEITP